MNCNWVMWVSYAMSNNTSDTRNSSTLVGGETNESCSPTKFLHCSKHPLNSLSSFAASCSFKTLSLNSMVQVSLGPSPSVLFEISVIHFSGSGLVSFVSSRAVGIRMSRRLSSVRSWLYEFRNSKKSSAPCIWICTLGLVPWVWRKRQGRLSVGGVL